MHWEGAALSHHAQSQDNCQQLPLYCATSPCARRHRRLTGDRPAQGGYLRRLLARGPSAPFSPPPSVRLALVAPRACLARCPGRPTGTPVQVPAGSTQRRAHAAPGASHGARVQMRRGRRCNVAAGLAGSRAGEVLFGSGCYVAPGCY
eukprot:scaffold306_cov525-Prasinococcus_capsulatus_cf.AAC.42